MTHLNIMGYVHTGICLYYFVVLHNFLLERHYYWRYYSRDFSFTDTHPFYVSRLAWDVIWAFGQRYIYMVSVRKIVTQLHVNSDGINHFNAWYPVVCISLYCNDHRLLAINRLAWVNNNCSPDNVLWNFSFPHIWIIVTQ